MQNHDIQLQPKIPRTAKIVFSIIAIFSFCCVFLVWYKTTAAIKSANEYQPLAVATMQKECALRCASYGLTEKDFIGPKLEHANIDKNASSYLFTWNASRKNMQLVVTLNSTGSIANTKIQTQWISLGAPNQSS